MYHNIKVEVLFNGYQILVRFLVHDLLLSIEIINS